VLLSFRHADKLQNAMAAAQFDSAMRIQVQCSLSVCSRVGAALVTVLHRADRPERFLEYFATRAGRSK
jgi:hypothetical protein